MMLCRVCMAIVLLIAIGLALDEVDIEYATRAVARFSENFNLSGKILQTTSWCLQLL